MKQIPESKKQNISKQRITNATCIITGGAGFIGSHIVDALATPALQNHIIIIDNLSTGKLANITHHFNNSKDNEAFQDLKMHAKPSNSEEGNMAYAHTSKTKEEQKEELELVLPGDHVTFIKADITNLALLQNIFKKYKPQFVFHLAAIASVPKSIKDPITTHDVNVTGTLNTLLAAKDNDVGKVIFSSSCAVYGNPPDDALPLKETQKSDPLSPYATSKLMGEYYCDIFSKTYNLPTVCLRYFNVYGPRQDPNGDYAAVIPKFISRIKQGKPLIIYGDGTQTRDFIYVDDVVNANIALAKSNNGNGNNSSDKDNDIATTNVFNVGTGEQTSIHFLANTLLSIHDTDLNNIEYQPYRSGDIHDSFADNTKLEHVLEQTGYNVPLDLKNGLIDAAGIDKIK